ncbi:polysaccharide biosynthesis tyrosine autokinase [Curtobacterium sp. NPDC087080]|uniref:polysaccharide biosynthesis tyrosine autokinase n=1 Tax=Curtobacterium sp. NPDC087080 TaxID=3363965 RepID=UPI00381E7CA9
MNPLLLVRALVSGWWIVAGATALGVVGAVGWTAITPPTYEATTSYYVSVAGQAETSAGEIAQGSTAAQQKIKSYVELASSPRVLAPVVRELGLAESPSALGARVRATGGTGTVILSIAVDDRDAARAAEIAARVGATLSAVVSQIEPETADGRPSVKLEEVTPAAEPTAPKSPRVGSNLAAGAFVGLLVGAGLALLAASLDTRIRRPQDLQTGTPLVGEISFDADNASRPLIHRDDVNSERAEAYRSLRTNIQFLGSGLREGRTIAVTSARPSEGKTTTTANLGIALSKSGLETLIVDADLRRPRVASLLGLEDAVGLTDVLVGRAELDDVVQDWGVERLAVLPAGTIPPNPSELVASEAMRQVLLQVRSSYDVVLVDTPPVLAVTDAALVSTVTDTTLLVVAAGQTRQSDVRSAVDALARVGQRPDGIVLSKVKQGRLRDAYRSAYSSRDDQA